MKAMQEGPTSGPVVNRKTALSGKIVYYMDRLRPSGLRACYTILCTEREMLLYRRTVAQRLLLARKALRRI